MYTYNIIFIHNKTGLVVFTVTAYHQLHLKTYHMRGKSHGVAETMKYTSEAQIGLATPVTLHKNIITVGHAPHVTI